MKKFTLIILVAMVPLLTMAQKRSKKGKEKVEKSFKKGNFMVITGIYEIIPNNYKVKESKGILKGMEANKPETQNLANFTPKQKMKITFDFGGIRSEENFALAKVKYRSMAQAVNLAAQYGWEFVSANVVDLKGQRTYYYYMRRKN